MALFDFDSAVIKEKYLALWYSLTGKEPCVAEPDKYTENWVNRAVDPEVAAELCEGCPALALCRDYAVTAKEKRGIWGGTTPAMRGIKPKKWRK